MWALRLNGRIAQESLDVTSATETVAGEEAAISQYMAKMIIYEDYHR